MRADSHPAAADPDATASTSTRGRGRPPRSTDWILGAALELADEQGTEALTFRALATRINGSTATLYRHFGTRSELGRRIVDHAVGEIRLDDTRPATRWDETITHIAEQLFAMLLRHPGVVPLMLEELPSGPHALALRATFRSALIQNGFSEQDATFAYATIARFVVGMGMQLRAEDADQPAQPAPGALGSVSLRQEFTYGLRLMITGLRTEHAAVIDGRQP